MEVFLLALSPLAAILSLASPPVTAICSWCSSLPPLKSLDVPTCSKKVGGVAVICSEMAKLERKKLCETGRIRFPENPVLK